jgi:hypothetical protein
MDYRLLIELLCDKYANTLTQNEIEDIVGIVKRADRLEQANHDRLSANAENQNIAKL